MVDRVSALAGHNLPGRLGNPGETGVILRDSQDLLLHQVAAWADSIDEVGKTPLAVEQCEAVDLNTDACARMFGKVQEILNTRKGSRIASRDVDGSMRILNPIEPRQERGEGRIGAAWMPGDHNRPREWRCARVHQTQSG